MRVKNSYFVKGLFRCFIMYANFTNSVIANEKFNLANFSDCVFERECFKNIYDNDENIAGQAGQDFIVIPLGCHCGVAWWMRQFNLRTFAFPFDWCITPYRAIYDIINNDFEDYFKKKNLVPSCEEYWSNYLYEFYRKIYHNTVDGSIGAVLDKHFQMLFTHDFPNHSLASIDQYYDSQNEKYTRRIKRFFDAVKSGKHVYFIRLQDITKKEALELYQLLKSKFATASFTLIVLGVDSEEFAKDWDIPHLKNIFISEETVNQMAPGTVFWEKFCKDLVAGTFK